MTKLFIDCRMMGSGGIGSYLSSLIPYFTKIYQCTLLGNQKDLEKYKSVSTEIIPCTIKTFSLKELLCFPKDILKKINSCDAYYTPYCNIPSGIKIPIFSTIHDVVFLDVSRLASKTGTLVRKFFYQYAINKSKIIFTVSNFSKERIQKTLKYKNKPIIVTYNALPHWFEQGNNLITQKENTILFVGNIKKHKGLHTLISAFKILTESKDNEGYGIEAKLVLVGNANNFRTGDSNIVEKINSLPQDKVCFTGKIQDEELREIYRSSRMLVQPSLYEGFGMPPLEALSLGTNVVLSDIPVFKEIYKDFPVTFFKTEDVKDLAKKIVETWEKPNPSNIPNKYSFEITSQIIFNTIDSSINKGDTK